MSLSSRSRKSFTCRLVILLFSQSNIIYDTLARHDVIANVGANHESINVG